MHWYWNEYTTKILLSVLEELVAMTILFFCDEEQLKIFALLCDEKKKNDCTIYRPSKNKTLLYLENVWVVKKDFKSTYGEDYRTLTSSENSPLDKYSTTIFSENLKERTNI